MTQPHRNTNPQAATRPPQCPRVRPAGQAGNAAPRVLATAAALALALALATSTALAAGPAARVTQTKAWPDGRTITVLAIDTGTIQHAETQIIATRRGVRVTVTACRYLAPCARKHAQETTRAASRRALARQLARERAAWQHERHGLRQRLLHQPSVQEALTIASVAYDVPRAQLASVAWCESTQRPTARNGRYRGIFQQGPMFEASPFGQAGLSVWSPYAAAMTTAYTVAREGWRQWECKP